MTITEALTLWPATEPYIPLPAGITYSTTSPCELQLWFTGIDLRHTFTYTLDRDLLADVLIAEHGQTVGAGTVQARQGDHVDHIVLRLWQDDEDGGEWWELLAAQERIEDIVRRVYALVPMGAECSLLAAQLDTVLASILAEAAR
jgi:hypothetical protein